MPDDVKYAQTHVLFQYIHYTGVTNSFAIKYEHSKEVASRPHNLQSLAVEVTRECLMEYSLREHSFTKSESDNDFSRGNAEICHWKDGIASPVRKERPHTASVVSYRSTLRSLMNSV
ncbi:hypothetical protein HNY73_010572 [Argiope bruennichi]|uniref:Uncharacterized protein n=1 Tax=Argiope bruennichi TaxID=94029 RepID=A0A8T0F3X5_ARGBR|nr:hypothetical protein HNY73_010572 [Argiope bruennichi]